MLYATYLAATIKPQSIKVYLYGVRNLHIENGFPCPLQGALQLRRLLRGIKRVKGLSPDSRLPITPSLLWRFFPQLWAAIMLAFLLCAVVALDRYLARTTVAPGHGLFRFANGTHLTRVRLNQLIRTLVTQCGVPPSRFSSHSFRIGAASTAATVGIPDWRIQALGRWSSDCYLRYIRLRLTEADSMATRLAQAPL